MANLEPKPSKHPLTTGAATAPQFPMDPTTWFRMPANAEAANPATLFNAAVAYMVDATQRYALFMDVLRERGNEQAEITKRPLATVLTFEHEILMSGRGLPTPIDYSLSRIIPPAGVKIDPKKRPVVIVDPRAGQGPGIGGFHRESEIGDAFDAGHPVYFIGFAAEPEPNQGFLDIVQGQVKFFERVNELHPHSPKPMAVGNCQAGYQTLMVAMLRPDLFGPILMPASPISYWQGVHGKNPMRYSGGLLGGSWLTALASDLSNGKFDAANLIANFDNLNPGNTAFKKLYDVYTNVDTEGPRFLGFEKWWGDFITLNGKELQYLVDEHFIGDKLVRNEIATPDGRLFDIRNVTSPIIVFTSLGDNISPPQQTLGWILDLYSSVDDIRAQGKTIVYCIDPKVGHLAIFVSPKVAVREHEAFMQTMDIIDALPPGLYELVVTPKTPGEPGADLVKSDFLARFEPRTLDDIRAFGRNSEADDRAFATVAKMSETSLAMYRTFLQPWIRAMSNEQTAELIRAMNPVRLQYTMFADSNPLMHWVKQAADMAAANRKPVTQDNLFLQWQEEVAKGIEMAWNAYRDARDLWEEKTFFAIYGSPVVQALFGTAAGVYPPRKPPAQTPQERERQAAALDGYCAQIDSGGPVEAMVRGLLYALGADRRFDERSAFVMAEIVRRADGLDLTQLKPIVRNQFFALLLDRERAMQALPRMAATPEDRRKVLAQIRDILDAVGTPTPETQARIAHVAELLDASAPAVLEDKGAASPADRAAARVRTPAKA